MVLRWVIMAAAAAVSSPALAGDLTPLVGTDAWLEVPPGFTVGHGASSGFTLVDESATTMLVTSQSRMPSPVQAEIFKDPLTPDQLEMLGSLLPGGHAAVRTVDGNQWLIIAGRLPNPPGQAWLVRPESMPNFAMSVTSLDTSADPTAAGEQAINGVLPSFAVSAPLVGSDGIDFGGLHLPAVAPFSFGQISETGMARLFTSSPDQAADGPRTYANLQFVSANQSVSTLEQLGNKWLKFFADSKVETSEERSILGEPALRQTWSGTANGEPITVIDYVGSYGGQPFILSVLIQTENATSDLIAAFDQIATSISISKNVPTIRGVQK